MAGSGWRGHTRSRRLLEDLDEQFSEYCAVVLPDDRVFFVGSLAADLDHQGVNATLVCDVAVAVLGVDAFMFDFDKVIEFTH